tara:strand:+ start:566 stop:754 length:189 start_codon:yes stop_codon:yes gene_type:complete
MNAVDYYRAYVEVQAAKQAERLSMKTELSTHEREKHMINVQIRQDNNVMAPKKWGNNLDIKA